METDPSELARPACGMRIPVALRASSTSRLSLDPVAHARERPAEGLWTVSDPRNASPIRISEVGIARRTLEQRPPEERPAWFRAVGPLFVAVAMAVGILSLFE